MDFRDDQNPYAPPRATDDQIDQGSGDDDLQVSAERGTRWLARFIDGLLGLVIAVPLCIVLFATDVMNMREIQRGNNLLGLYLWAAELPILIYQWSLIARTGQSLGKKWLGIKVIKADGGRVDFVSGVVMREWVMTAISFVPLVGSLINLVGILMIFGEERRCLHDRIAGTKVIAVLKS